MSMIERQVGRAQMRLTLNVLGERLMIALAVAIGLWTAWVLVDRAFALGTSVQISLLAALGIATFITGVGVWRRRVTRLAAAVAIDAAAGLKERVSSAIVLSGSRDPFAVATVNDAQKVAASVHVPSRVPLRAPRNWPAPLGALMVALLAWAFMPTLDVLAARSTPDETPDAAVEHQNIQLAIDQQLAQVRDQLSDKPGLSELAKEMEELSLPDKPASTPEDVRRDALKKLDNVAEKLEERRREESLSALSDLKEKLSRLEATAGEDAVSRLAQSLQNGDLGAAQQAMSELQKMMESGELDESAREALAQMQAKLEALSEQLMKMDDSLKLQKELENKAGLTEEQARELMKKLANMDPAQLEKALREALQKSGMSEEELKELARKMCQNQKLCQQAQQLAKAMAQAASACQSAAAGNSAPSEAMQSAMGTLSELEKSEQMLQALEAQLNGLSSLRAGVCQGRFAGDCTEPGTAPGGYEGEAPANMPLEVTKASTKNIGGGQIIGQMIIDGMRPDARASAELRDVVSAALRDATDAIERQRAPQQYHRVMREYFESLAGLGEDAPAPDAPTSQPQAE